MRAIFRSFCSPVATLHRYLPAEQKSIVTTKFSAIASTIVSRYHPKGRTHARLVEDGGHTCIASRMLPFAVSLSGNRCSHLETASSGAREIPRGISVGALSLYLSFKHGSILGQMFPWEEKGDAKMYSLRGVARVHVDLPEIPARRLPIRAVLHAYKLKGALPEIIMDDRKWWSDSGEPRKKRKSQKRRFGDDS